MPKASLLISRRRAGTPPTAHGSGRIANGPEPPFFPHHERPTFSLQTPLRHRLSAPIALSLPLLPVMPPRQLTPAPHHRRPQRDCPRDPRPRRRLRNRTRRHESQRVDLPRRITVVGKADQRKLRRCQPRPAVANAQTVQGRVIVRDCERATSRLRAAVGKSQRAARSAKVEDRVGRDRQQAERLGVTVQCQSAAAGSGRTATEERIVSRWAMMLWRPRGRCRTADPMPSLMPAKTLIAAGLVFGRVADPDSETAPP